MKKESVKILGIVLASLFLISLLAGIAAAAQNVKSELFIKVKEILTSVFGGSETYDYISNILSPQILFAVLIFLVIFAIIEQISIFNKKRWLSVGISIIISILAAGFIKIDYIKPLLNQYEAIGVTISFVIPFVLLFYFLKEVAPHNRLVQWFIWAVFSVLVLASLILNWDKADSKFTKFLYVLIFILGLVMLIAGNWILGYIFKEQLQEAFEKFEDLDKMIRMGRKADAEKAYSALAGSMTASQRAKFREGIDTMP